MKFLTPLVLTIAIAAVSAADDSTSASRMMSSSLSSSSSSFSDEFTGSESDNGVSSTWAGSLSNKMFGSAGSDESEDVDVGDSYSMDGSSGSELFDIDIILSSVDDSGSRTPVDEESASASTDSGSSSGATSLQSMAFYTTATVIMTIGTLY